MKTTLRDLMTDEIRTYGWLDFQFRRSTGYQLGSSDVDAYFKWLSALSDIDFLARYNEVRDSINNLD